MSESTTMRVAARKRVHILSLCLLFAMTVASPRRALAQQADDSVDVTHGGYGVFGGAIALAILAGATGAAARQIYANPIGVDCTAEPARCRRTPLEHVLVGSMTVAVIAGTIGGGIAAQKLTEKWQWNPVTGWALAGAYLGLPTTLLLQNAIPKWEPDWSRDLFGATLGVGGAIGAAYAFRAIAMHEGHAWPEFGFGAGGMGLGLVLGSIFTPNTIWVPILGGLGAVIGASAATLAF